MSFNHPTGVLQPSGLTEEAFLHSSELCSSPKFDIRWANAESRIVELLSLIQPNGPSELRRKTVADYVSGLIHKSLGCEVFKFGSVPLKTYLPDGDIDLTAFSHYQELRDTWASDVQTVLEHEEHRKDAECRVSKVQCIHAEVKLVKCVVENIVVDISFNQLGGLCTLCFLEEVDRLIQKDHLFKRSILLVKAWCYYESRIVGAHHGLISTYALETLVLYIFNVFHSNLRGPLEVLLTFLDYFSKFDWDRYCISLWGPVPLTSLPDLTVEPPLKGGGKLLLSKAFLESCSAQYDVFPKGQDSQARTFGGKFFNIVDPLRTNNNLGRSVSQANFYRIRSAFRRGACELAKLFEVDDVDFPKCLDEFFSNTWERHQSRCRPDAPSNFPPQQTFVYKADILGTLHSSDKANNVSGMPPLEKPTVPSREKLTMDKKAQSPHSPSRLGENSPSSIGTRDSSTETAGWKSNINVFSHNSNPFKGLLESNAVDKTQMLSCAGGEVVNLTSGIGKTTKGCPNTHLNSISGKPFTVGTDSHSKTRTISPGLSMSSKQRPEFPAALRRTISEGRIEKNLDAGTRKNGSLPVDVQDINVWQTTSGRDSKEVPKSACSSIETKQVEGLPRPSKISSGYSKLKICESCGSPLALDSGERTQHCTANNTTTNDTPTVCMTACNTAPQKPPGFLFPESRDLLYTPPAAPFSLSSFSPSSNSSVLFPSPFLDSLYSPDLDVQKSKAAQEVNNIAISMAPIEILELPLPPPVPSYEEAPSMARTTPVLNGTNAMNASRTHIPHLSFNEMEQQLLFCQQSEQGQPLTSIPGQTWLPSREVLSVSQHNHADLSAPNARAMRHSEARRSVVSNAMEKASNRTREGVPLHAEDLAEIMKADDKMQPQRQESLHAQILPGKKGDKYGGSEVVSHAFSALPVEVNANSGSDFPDQSGKGAFGSSGSDGHNLPGYALYFGQPFPTFEATMPGLEKIVHPGPDATHQPGVLIDSSVSHAFGTSVATGSLVKEGGNQLAEGTPTLYLPMGVFPAVSYYNPFYSMPPAVNPEFQDGRVNSSSPHGQQGDKTERFVGSDLEDSPSQAFHDSRQKLNSTTSAPTSAKFASLSAGGGKKEPSKDLLKSDLANHVRNLQFGRWCQEPVLQPYLESPSLYHTSQVPVMWGVSPFTPFPGTTGSFNHEFGDVKGLIPVPFSPQSFNSMPQNLPWPGTAESVRTQELGKETLLPLSDTIYKDMESLSPQIATQFDQRTFKGRQEAANTWRMPQVSTMNHPSAIHASITPSAYYGACNGANGYGSISHDHGVRSTCPPDQFPGSVFPLVTGQLEFGSLGPIEIISFSDAEVGTRQLNKYSTADASSNSFPTFLAREANQTVPNVQK